MHELDRRSFYLKSINHRLILIACICVLIPLFVSSSGHILGQSLDPPVAEPIAGKWSRSLLPTFFWLDNSRILTFERQDPTSSATVRILPRTLDLNGHFVSQLPMIQHPLFLTPNPQCTMSLSFYYSDKSMTEKKVYTNLVTGKQHETADDRPVSKYHTSFAWMPDGHRWWRLEPGGNKLSEFDSDNDAFHRVIELTSLSGVPPNIRHAQNILGISKTSKLFLLMNSRVGSEQDPQAEFCSIDLLSNNFKTETFKLRNPDYRCNNWHIGPDLEKIYFDYWRPADTQKGDGRLDIHHNFTADEYSGRLCQDI